MNTVIRRLHRLEEQFAPADRPRRRIRLVLCMAGAKPSLVGATCQRTLSPDGTLWEIIMHFTNHNYGRELEQDEIERWVDGFPIRDCR